MTDLPNPEVAILNAALELPASQRADYLDDACAGNAALRGQVEALLQAHEQAEGFLEAPPAGLDFQRTVRVDIPLTEKPGDRIGRYKLLQQIGEGGCGVVYMAEQEEPVRRRVALKVIKLGMDTKQVIARFEAERQALALMDHPNIAKIFDAGITETATQEPDRDRSPVAAATMTKEPSESATTPSSVERAATGDRSRSVLSAGRPYFVMELVRGIKITDFCDENNLSTQDRLKLFIQVCQAIQHAHQKGVIHRDIKPSNILVTINDGVPVPKVIDFGIAKATQGRLTDHTLFTAFEQFIGTPAYMSPEQAVMTSLDIDTRSDIYSLGVLLYELLTGRTPFDQKELLAAGLDEMRRTIREKEPLKPSTRLTQELVAADKVGRVTPCAPPLDELSSEDGAHGVTRPTAKSEEEVRASSRRLLQVQELVRLLRGDLDWIVMKCLEKDRARRYETANGLAMDIQCHLHDEPVIARPPSKLYRFQKLVRRNKLAFAAGAAVATVLVVGVVVSTWQAIRATRAEREQTRLRQIAETKEKKSEQVAQFLKDMLEGVGPSVALGRDTAMLKEILDKTAQRVGKDLTNQPDVEAELLQTLGEVSYVLGQFEKAETWLSQALALRKELFGHEHAEVANSLDSLALALYGQDRLPEAEKIGRAALDMQRKTRGNSHTNVATSLNNLGITLTVAGRWNEAETAYREALTMRTNLLGNEHPEVAVTLNCLAQALGGAGNLREAESVQRRALAIQQKVLPDPHHDLALSLNNLANFLQIQGKLDQAEPLYREALKMDRSVLGDHHSDLGTPLNNYGLLLERMGLWAEAEAAHSEALAIRRKAFTNDHQHVAFSLNNLASLRAATGRLEEAEALHRDTLAMRRRLLGEDHADVAASICNLARVFRQQGRVAEAEAMQNDALARRRKLPGGEHPSVAVSLNELGLVLRAQGKSPEAERVLRDAFALRTKVLRSDDSNLAESAENLAMLLCDLGQFAEAGKLARQSLAIREMNYPDDRRRYNALTILGIALLGQKQFAEAEPLLLSGYEGMKEREGRIPVPEKPRLKEILGSLVQLYEATARSDQAAEWRKELTRKP